MRLGEEEDSRGGPVGGAEGPGLVGVAQARVRGGRGVAELPAVVDAQCGHQRVGHQSRVLGGARRRQADGGRDGERQRQALGHATVRDSGTKRSST